MAERIYVADDELHIRTLIQTFLANEGYEVEIFGDGDSLYRAFKERCPELIILDTVSYTHLDAAFAQHGVRHASAVPDGYGNGL